MHCQKTTTIRCFLEATYDLLVVLRETVDLYPLFWCTFSQISWFLMILDHFNRKMDILDHFWGPLTASCPKVTIYLPLTPWTLSKPVKTLSKPYFLTTFGPPLRVQWEVADIRPSKMALFDLARNGTKWCKYAQNLLPAPLKLPCANWGTKPPFYTFDTLFWTPIFDLQNKMLICSALIEGPSK